MGMSSPARRHNRSWPAALKREIVVASLAPGASVSLVARHYDVNTNQLFSWRKLYRSGLLGSDGPSLPALVPVTVAPPPSAGAAQPEGMAGTIEIELGGKYRLRVGSGVDERALRRVLDALERR
jgi:transposase